MPLRLLHTADWHLGHQLHDHPRHEEHASFLAWLVEALVRHEVDALLIAGDVFDTHNPSAQAQAQWYGFLAEATARRPGLQVIAIAGNHDSAERLAAPAPLLHRQGVRVVGALPRAPGGGLSCEELVFPLADATGQTQAWVVAMPFLRPVDLPPGEDLAAGVAARYAEAFAFARAKKQEGQALVAMGHAYLAATQLSELSERKILGGNQHALDPALFPADLAYTALGHLHLAQGVGRPLLRYSGSPLPLSMAETDYPHQVVLVELEPGGPARWKALPVPRTVPFLRLPPDDFAPLEALLTHVKALPEATEASGPPAFLELRLRLEGSPTRAREALLQALQGKAARLVALRSEALGPQRPQAPTEDLKELSPEEVFRRRHEQQRQGQAPSEATLARFHELLAQAQEAEG